MNTMGRRNKIRNESEIHKLFNNKYPEQEKDQTVSRVVQTIISQI